jgi:MFS family permease
MIASKIGPKTGIKKVLLVSNAVALIANLVKVIQTSTTIYLGRLVFSICAGAANFCIGKAISETVPSQFGQRYGILVNSGIQLGVLISTSLGVFLPNLNREDPANLEALRNDKNWRLIWLVPVIFELVSLAFIHVFYKYLSLKKLI